jgi:hypothetical protein
VHGCFFPCSPGLAWPGRALWCRRKALATMHVWYDPDERVVDLEVDRILYRLCCGICHAMCLHVSLARRPGILYTYSQHVHMCDCLQSNSATPARITVHVVARRLSALENNDRACKSGTAGNRQTALSCNIGRDDASHSSDASKKKKNKKRCHCMQPVCTRSSLTTRQLLARGRY